MDKVIKTHIGEIRSVDEKNFTLEAIVSDETIDRYQEVIKIDAWKKGLKNYQKHGVLLSSHNYGTLTNQIGIAEKVRVEDGKLIAKFKYFTNSGNPEADWGWFLAKQGLAAYSVGFLPRPNGYETASWDEDDVKAGKKPLRTYTDVELLEISQVTVPANPSALQKSVEDESDPVIKEYSEMIYQKLFLKQEELIPLDEDFSEMVTKDLEVPIGKDIDEEKVLEVEEKEQEVRKSEEEDEMILKAIEELKAEMSERFNKIEEKFTQWEKEDEEYKRDLEEFTAELEKEQKEIEEEDVVLNQLEADEDYIKSLLSEQNALLAVKFSVQSK
jgi:phage head maturation protease